MVFDRGEVVLPRHGKTVAIAVSPDVLRTRWPGAALHAVGIVSSVLDCCRAASLHPDPSLTLDQAGAMAAEVRTSRSQHSWASRRLTRSTPMC